MKFLGHYFKDLCPFCFCLPLIPLFVCFFLLLFVCFRTWKSVSAYLLSSDQKCFYVVPSVSLSDTGLQKTLDIMALTFGLVSLCRKIEYVLRASRQLNVLVSYLNWHQ